MFTGVAFQLNVSSSSSFAFSLKISCIWLLIIEMIDLVFCGTFSNGEIFFNSTHAWAVQRIRIKYYVRMFVCLFISLLIASQTNKQIKKVKAQSIALYSINAAECWLRELRVCPKWLETHSYVWFNFMHFFPFNSAFPALPSANKDLQQYGHTFAPGLAA